MPSLISLTFLAGWIAYFRLAQVKGTFEDFDGWLRRKMRCILWHQWKRPRTRATKQSRSRKSAQDDKWSFCLTAGTLCPRIRRSDDQTSPPEPHTGLQG
jgi:Group II intron, maturase-specific domain